MRPKHLQFLTALSSLLIAAAGVTACRQPATARPSEHANAPTTPAVNVRTAAVVDTVIHLPIVATGVLAAKEEPPLSFKIGGVIGHILVEEGQPVRAGQLLAELELPEIAAQVARAQAGLDKADRDLARARALYTDSVIPLERYQDASTARDVAAADLRIAEFNQQYAAIRAPTAGTILRRMAEPNELVGPGSPILVFGSVSRGQVMRIGLADRDVVRVAVGDHAAIMFVAHPGVPYRGRVTQVAAAASPGSGTYEVEIRLESPVMSAGSAWTSGLIGKVEIAPSHEERVRLIPIEALLEGDSDSGTVYTVAENGTTAKQHRVAVAFLAGTSAALRGAEADSLTQVITDGAAYLIDGASIRLSAGDAVHPMVGMVTSAHRRGP